MVRKVLASLFFLAFFGAVGAWAQFPVPVRSGDDTWITPAAGTFVSFATTPIPAGFFGAGSDAFTGTVGFVGSTLPTTPVGALGTADTLVTRLDNLSFGALGTLNTRIQMKALALASTAPVTVTYGGGSPEQWTVKLTLSTVLAQPIGNMAITLACVNGGGNFTSQLPVVPRFIFTNVLTGFSLVLDCGTIGNGVCGTTTIRASSCWSRPAPLGPAAATCLQPIPAGVRVDGNCDGASDYVTVGRRDFLPGVQGCGPAGCNYCTSTEAHPVGAQHQVIGGACPNPGLIPIATSTVRQGAQVISCQPVVDPTVKPLTDFKFTGPIVFELNDVEADGGDIEPTPDGN